MLSKLFRPGYSTGFAVSQRGAGANMSVDVATGEGQLLRPAGDYSYYGWADTVQNVTISSADPSNPRRDIIVAYVDLSVVDSSTSNNPGALKFLAVAGTPAGSPSDPSDSTIQSTVGASNPYIKLARVAVAAAASSIVDANITDLRSPMALLMNYLWGGASNTKGHLVPNVADDTVALLNAAQTFAAKTLTEPTIGDFTNANHDHSATNKGGAVTAAALSLGLNTHIISPTAPGNMSTSSFADVTGGSITITVPSNASTVLILGTVSLASQTSGTYDMFARVVMDGSPSSLAALAKWTTVGSFNGGSVGLVDLFTGVSAGSHTFKLQARSSSGAALNPGSATSGTNILVIPLNS